MKTRHRIEVRGSDLVELVIYDGPRLLGSLKADGSGLTWNDGGAVSYGFSWNGWKAFIEDRHGRSRE